MNQELWLAEYIELAFAGVTLGDGIDIYAAQSMDDYGNPDEDRLSLSAERLDWRRVPSDHLFPRYWAITFLDAGGFRFYTPAIMTALLTNQLSGESLSDWFFANLTINRHGLVKEARFNDLFSLRQRAAIIRFLKYAIYNRARRFNSDEAARRLMQIKSYA